LHQRDTGGGTVRTINIHVGPTIAANALATNAARSVPTLGTAGRKTGLEDVLLGAGAAQGEDNDWRYLPGAYQMLPGCPIIVCAAQLWSGSVYQDAAVALIVWDETLAGANKFRLVYRGPTIQIARPRGAQWMMPQAFSLGNPNELWLTFVDYRINPDATGGQAFICRFTRSGPGQPFVPGAVLPLIQNIEGYAGTHFHCVGITRFGASGMACVIAQGDSLNARTYVMVRDNENYLEGENGSFVCNTLQDPTAEEINVGRGWRLYPNAAGSPISTTGGSQFTNCAWDNTAKTLSGTGLGNGATAGQVGNRVGHFIVINSGPGITAPIYDRVSAHTGTTVTLPNINIANGSYSGIVCAVQACHQPVACHQLPDGRLYFGCDESNPAGTIMELPTFAPGDRVIRWRGVGDSTTGHAITQEWNQFQAVTDINNRGRFYIGKYESSSFDSDPAGRIMVSDDAATFATVYAPNANLMPTLGMHGLISSGGVSWLLYTTAFLTFAVRAPDFVQRVRPLLSAAPAYTNHAISTLGTSTVAGADGSPLAAWSAIVDRTALPTLIAGHVIPPPPGNGPIISIQNRGEFGFNRPITSATLANNQRIRVSGWWYNLPQTNPNGETISGAYDNTSAQPFFAFYPSGQNSFTRRAIDAQFQRIDGYGWQPFTITLGRPTTEWVGGDAANITGPFALGMTVRSESGNRWQLWQALVCVDSVVQADEGEMPVISPPVSTTSVAFGAASTRINVPISGTAWSCILRGSIPKNGADEYTANRAATRSLFTLSNGTTYLRVFADPVNNRISVTDGTNTINCAAPGTQLVHFDRGGQLTIGLALTGTTLTVAASVDGTAINTASGTVIATTYDRVLSGDQTNANAEPMEWWAVEGYNTALNATQLGDEIIQNPTPSNLRSRSIGLGLGLRLS
jgi:hypothetical protein